MKYSLQTKPNSPYYFCVFNVVKDGMRKQVWKSTKCRNIDDAHERSKDILAEYNTGFSRKELTNVIDNILNTPEEPESQQIRDEHYNRLNELREYDKKKKQLHFEYLINDYIPNVMYSSKSESLCDNIIFTIKKLNKYLSIDNLYALNKKNVAEFKNLLLKDGLNNNTVLLNINYINSLYKSLYENDYMHTLIRFSSGLSIIESDKIYTLEDDEFEVVLNHAFDTDYNLYLIFLIQGYTGLRISEVVNARWEWFVLRNNELYLNVRNEEANDDTLEYRTKNRKNRMVFIPKKFIEFFNLINKDSGYILKFDKRYEVKIKTLITNLHNNIKKFMLSMYNKGLIQHIYTSHDFRRYFATRMYKNGTDLFMISKQLGHSNVTTTERYLRLDYLARNSSSIKF